MSNPYQPAKLVDDGFNGDRSEACWMSTCLGILAAILGTPITYLFVIASATIVIWSLGLDVDLDAFADDPRFHGDTMIWVSATATLCGLSAYFAIRSSICYLSGDRKQGGVFLFLSLVISPLILLLICVFMLFNIAMRNAI